MSKLFNSLHIVHNFSANFVKKISREYMFNKSNILRLKQSRIKKNIYLCDNKIYTSYNRKAVSLLNLLMELNSLPINVNKFDNSYVYFAKNTILPKQNSKKIKNEAKKLLSKINTYPIIKMLYNSGVFVNIFPYAKNIINQPQFDGYHIHPVDMHTIYALKYLYNIKDKFVKSVYDNLSTYDKGFLNILVFFHDLGKGKSKEHSLVGQDIFKNYSNNNDFNEEDINIALTVIKHHNYMSYVATTQDIYSQKIILNFTALIKNKRALDLLYCLTYADINSVGSKIYNSTNSSLIRELYLQCIDAFENTSLLKDSTRRLKKENAIKNNSTFKSLSKLMQKRILKIESNQLFFIYKSQDIIDLAIKAKDVFDIDFEIENTQRLVIKIIRLLPINLGYLLSKLSFLNISGMHIFKLYDDKKYFDIVFSQNVDDSDILFIQEIIKNSFDMNKDVKFTKPIISKQSIDIDLDHSDDLIQIQINTNDQKGLFAYIAYVFDKYDIDIQSAKINTRNKKVNDLLLIQKNGNFIQNKNKILDELITKEE